MQSKPNDDQLMTILLVQVLYILFKRNDNYLVIQQIYIIHNDTGITQANSQQAPSDQIDRELIIYQVGGH